MALQQKESVIANRCQNTLYPHKKTTCHHSYPCKLKPLLSQCPARLSSGQLQRPNLTFSSGKPSPKIETLYGKRKFSCNWKIFRLVDFLFQSPRKFLPQFTSCQGQMCTSATSLQVKKCRKTIEIK